MPCLGKKAIRRWKETVVVRRSISVESGAVIRKRAVRRYFRHGGQGYVCPIDLPAYQAAEKACAVAFGKKPLAVRRGGSIPIISTFEQVLGIKTVLMGFGLEQNAIHSPNESCTLDFFYKGIESVAEFYKEYK